MLFGGIGAVEVQIGDGEMRGSKVMRKKEGGSERELSSCLGRTSGFRQVSTITKNPSTNTVVSAYGKPQWSWIRICICIFSSAMQIQGSAPLVLVSANFG